jgi:transcriptional regulator with XRE-family HTH domain
MDEEAWSSVCGYTKRIGFVKKNLQDKKPKAVLVCKKEPSRLKLDMGALLGNRIRSLRVEKGLTLPGLADKADLSKGLLYQIETSDKANPSLETLNKIAKGLGVTIAVLLEKDAVRAKRIVPESFDPGLEAFIKSSRENGEPLNESTLQALYVLQHRAGASAKSKEDWAWLYRSIEFSFGQKARRNVLGG